MSATTCANAWMISSGRVRFRDEWLYVYLLIEFQSSVDPFMAVRVLTYLGLLYQDILRAGQLTRAGRLPPVLPVVLYNGRPRWDAATEVADLIEQVPGGLGRYRPALRYLLIDEGRYAEGELAPLRNLAAALFRLENSRTPQDMERVLEALVEWLKMPEQTSLRRTFRMPTLCCAGANGFSRSLARRMSCATSSPNREGLKGKHPWLVYATSA